MNTPNPIKERISEDEFIKNHREIISSITTESSEKILEGNDGEEILMMSMTHYEENYEDAIATVETVTFADLTHDETE